jgi:hypothetical protein
VVESVTFLEEMPQEYFDLQAWFLDATADNADTQKMILSVGINGEAR